METIEAKPRLLHWIALALLVISVCINYADRGNLGVAAKSIQTELHFSPQQLGVLLAAFSLTYALTQLLAGPAIDRWNVNWLYAAGFLIWSGATGLTGFASSFSTILCLRLVLGAGESVAYPAYSKIIAAVFPERLRGTANALIDVGSKVGPALGVMLGVKLLNQFTWRGMFIVIAIASGLWLIPWCSIVPRLTVAEERRLTKWSPTYRQLIRTRSFWGTVLGLFGANYAWFFVLNWIPYYFETDRHITGDRLALFASLPFWAVAGASMLLGLFADALIKRGHEAGRVRQGVICCGLLGCCILMVPAVLVRQQVLFQVFLFGSLASMGGFSSNHWALSQRLSGVEAAAKWTGFQNCIGNFAGIVANYLGGLTLALTHSFIPAFGLAVLAMLAGVCGYWFIVGAPVPVNWDKPALPQKKVGIGVSSPLNRRNM
ncbi:MAG TPA: MFS transporter [Bryobacteraceae bacterium]|nr:MFS transporter [Bryobacteraceae bacterium]